MANAKNELFHGVNFATLDKEIDATIKQRRESDLDLHATTAKCWIAFTDGRSGYINRLYAGLGNSDRVGIAAYFSNRLMDVYGVGGKRDPDSAEKWIERPARYFGFRNTPKPEQVVPKTDIPEYFYLVPLSASKDKPLPKYLTPDVIANMKATKVAVLEAGAEELSKMEWITADKAAQIVRDFSVDKFKKQSVRMLTQLAENAGKFRFTKANLQRMLDEYPESIVSAEDHANILAKYRGKTVEVETNRPVVPADEPNLANAAQIAASIDGMAGMAESRAN